MSRYRAIFLDLDHTLWDFNSNSHRAMKISFDLFEFHRYFTDFDGFYSRYAAHNEQLWADYRDGVIDKEFLSLDRFLYPFRSIGVDNPALAEAFGSHYLEGTTRQSQLMPHARELLEYLVVKYPLYIITNGFSEVQFKKMHSSQISHYFKGVILSEEVGFHKPHPAIFDYACTQADVLASESLMIGDSWQADIVGAMRSGIDQIYYTPNGDDTYGSEATYRVYDLLEITAIL